jgi:hypothetical protein
MLANKQWQLCFTMAMSSLLLTACVPHDDMGPPAPQQTADNGYPYSANYDETRYQSRLPSHIDMSKEKVLLVDPKSYAWGAYDSSGNLIKGGIATAGADYCPDTGVPCRTTTGSFRVTAMRGEDCASHIYPVGKGGALMPYCTFFHGGESLHGSPDNMLVEQNISHGCIHIRIPDAEWIQNNFATIGTKVVILSY